MKKFAAAALTVLLLSSCGTSADSYEAIDYPEREIISDDSDINTESEPAQSFTEQKTESVTQAVTESAAEASEPATQAATKEKRKEYKIDVPYCSQSGYPTGCELVSTSMLLAFYGFEVNVKELIEKEYIKTASLPVEKDGKIVGSDPDDAFIGSPENSSSYGCYCGAVIKGIRKYFESERQQLMPLDISGYSLEDICTEYIDNDIPALVWETIAMESAFELESNKWYIEEKNKDFIWKSNEHCMVLVGYDENSYYFNDPLVGKSVAYSRELSEKRYEEMERQAVVIVPTK